MGSGSAAGRRCITPLRSAAQAIFMPERGESLHCDRGNALYVVRSERRIDWEQAGFLERREGIFTYLIPCVSWLPVFCAWAQVNRLDHADALQTASFGEIEEEDLLLWIQGIKLVELGASERETYLYERRARQRAAVCLRQRHGGGTLSAAALCIGLLRRVHG